MRLRFAALLTLAIACSAFGQTYTIQTLAGGGLPENIAGTSAGLGRITWVAVDAGGNVYFTLPDYFVVMRLDAVTGVLTRVAGNGTPGSSGDGGPAASAQLHSPGALAVDATGSLYIADNDRVRYVYDGLITTVAGGGSASPGDNGLATSARLDSPAGLAVDSAHNLYIADAGNNVVREVQLNGVITTVAGSYLRGYNGDNIPATSAQLNNPAGIAVDGSGTLYIADSSNGLVRKVAGGMINTATSVLPEPQGVAVDSSGNVYVSDSDSGRVLELKGGFGAWVAGDGASGFSGDGAPAVGAWLFSPHGVALGSSGNLYIADTGNFRVRMVSNGIISTVAGGGDTVGDNGPAAGAWLDYPAGVAVDPSGAVYIMDSENHRLRKVSNGVIATVAGSGTPGCTGDNGPASGAQLGSLPQFAMFGDPQGVAADPMGNVYITDLTCDRVRRVSGGTITTAAGDGKTGSSGDNGPAASAQLNAPEGIAADSSGNLYIADSGNNSVRKVSNGVIATVAGGGGQLQLPSAVALDSSGNLYIADEGNHRVVKVAGGIVTTVAGGGSGCDDCPATSAYLNGAEGIALDQAGNLYILETQSHIVRKVSGGMISTIAGNGTPGYSGDGGAGAEAQLWYPQGLALDAAGDVYIADTLNQRVRVLTPTGSLCAYAIVAPASPAPAAGGSLTVAIQAGSGCAWAVQSLPDWVDFSADAVNSGPGSVTLMVAANPGAARTATVSIAGAAVSIAQQGTLAINPGGMLNAASYAQGAPVAYGSMVAVFGSYLISSPSADQGFPLPTSLGGISLLFGDGAPAPLFFTSSGQVNLQVPWELAGLLQTSVTVTLNGATSVPQTVTLTTYAPGIFTMNAQGAGQGMILDSSYRLLDSSNGASRGNTVALIFCTGLGPVSNQPRTGDPAPADPLAETTTTPIVTIGGVPAMVSFSGLAPGYVGLYQVNALVPEGSAVGSAVPVTVSIGGATSNAVTIAVQ
jgi:trimeric autotransporter adhesin